MLTFLQFNETKKEPDIIGHTIEHTPEDKRFPHKIHFHNIINGEHTGTEYVRVTKHGEFVGTYGNKHKNLESLAKNLHKTYGYAKIADLLHKDKKNK